MGYLQDLENLMEHVDLPTDRDDDRYVQSFIADEVDSNAFAVQDFFETYGFVVFRNVIEPNLCQSTIDDMWDLLEERNKGVVKRNDPSTWNCGGWTSFGAPRGTYGLLRASLFRLRQHANVFKCFAGILKNSNIIVGHDRWLMYRPTIVNGEHKPGWEGKTSIHLDLNPVEYFDRTKSEQLQARLNKLNYKQCYYNNFITENNDVHESMGLSVQGMLNMTDLPSDIDNGGTVVIPGSHHILKKWAKANLRKFPKKTGSNQYRVDQRFNTYARRVTMRAGSLLIWDQRLFHGGHPNKSDQFRIGVPIRFFDKSTIHANTKRMQTRIDALKESIKDEGFEDELTPLGRKVFGLDLWEEKEQE